MPPATYEQLLAETLPTRINDEEQYDSMRARFGELLASRRRTRAEDQLLDLLGILIGDYDRRNAMPPDDSSPAEIIRFLIEHSGKTSADLTPVFGQRSHVNEALMAGASLARIRPASSANYSASVLDCSSVKVELLDPLFRPGWFGARDDFD